MRKLFRKSTCVIMSACLIFLTACSSAEKTGKENIELMLSTLFVIEEDVMNTDKEGWEQAKNSYIDNAVSVAKTVSSDDYMADKVYFYVPVVTSNNRTSSKYSYVDIFDNEDNESENYKDFLITVYVDCTYSNRGNACEVINGQISIDKTGKITYFNLEM